MAEPIWGRTFPVTLPSGARVHAKRVSITTILWAGGFPSELAAIAWKLFNQEIDQKSLSTDPEALKKMVGIVEQIVPHVLADPRVAEQTELTVDDEGFSHGTVKLGDVNDLDKQWLMLFGQGLILTSDEKGGMGATGPQSFRDGAVRDDVGSGGAAVQSAPVGDDRAAAG